jgi:hypothetical protein
MKNVCCKHIKWTEDEGWHLRGSMKSEHQRLEAFLRWNWRGKI